MTPLKGGESSSLGELADSKLKASITREDEQRAPPRIVPIISMTRVLDALARDDLTLWYLKTDMQGFDFSGALRAAGHRLHRFNYVATEVHLLRVAGYSGAHGGNDYCLRTLPLMLARGFQPVALLTWWSLTFEERGSLRQPELPRGQHTNEWPFLFHEGAHGQSSHAGTREARAYCQREADYLARHNASPPTGLREGNAYFRRAGTTLPLPPVEHKSENWVFANAQIMAGTGKLKLW